jgi:Na+/melibiose symporter-like transporter
MSDTTKEIGTAEETLLEPVIPRGPALPPHLRANRPFLWLVIGTGVGGVSFWSFFGAVWADGAFRFHASPGEMTILLGAFSLPFVLLVPVQGIAVDRWSPKWMNLLGYAVAVAGMPIAWAGDSLAFLYASSFVAGVGAAMVMPARSALTGLLNDESRLVQANGALSAAIQLSIIIGPLYAGLVLRGHETNIVYAAAVATGVASLGVMLLVPDRRQTRERPALALRDVGQGFLTSWRLPELRLLLGLYGMGWLVSNAVFVLEPLFVKDTLHLGGDVVQFIWVAHGVGAFLGAVWMTRLRRGAGLELLLVGASLVVLGAGLLLIYSIATYATALIGAGIDGLGFSVFLTAGLALVQRVVGEEQFGRVTSVFAILQEGTSVVLALVIVPLGALVLVRPTLIVSAVAIATTGLLGLVALRSMEARTSPAR